MARPHALGESWVAEKKKWRTPSVTERRHSDTSHPFSLTNTPPLAHTPKPAFPPPQNSKQAWVGSQTGARLVPTSPDVGSCPCQPARLFVCLVLSCIHTHRTQPARTNRLPIPSHMSMCVHISCSHTHGLPCTHPDLPLHLRGSETPSFHTFHAHTGQS